MAISRMNALHASWDVREQLGFDFIGKSQT
jgi:hypothetical protein